MSLSQEKIDLIQSSFKLVAPIAETAASIFYDNLFKLDPKLKELFPEKMDEQGKKLMQTLGVAVASLNDLDALVPVLQNLAVKHVDYGVKEKDYAPVGIALVETLKQGLGEEFTAETQLAWTELVELVFSVMKQAAYPELEAS